MKSRPSAQTPLGIKVKAGAHACLLYSDPAEVESAVQFLAEGIHAGEACGLLAYSRFIERVAAQLRDLHGVDVRALQLDGSLLFMSGSESVREMRAELLKFFSKRGRKAARLLLSLGWGEAGWPDDNELLGLEVQLNELCLEHGVAALCLYDTRQLSGSLVYHGAFESHGLVLCRGETHKNPFFAIAALQRELGAKRRDDGRLRSWMT